MEEIIRMYGQLSASSGSSFNQPQIEDILGKKIPKSPKKQNLNLPHIGNCLHSTYIVFTQNLHCIRSYKESRDDLKYTGGCA